MYIYDFLKQHKVWKIIHRALDYETLSNTDRILKENHFFPGLGNDVSKQTIYGTQNPIFCLFIENFKDFHFFIYICLYNEHIVCLKILKTWK